MLDPAPIDFALSTTRSVRRRIDFERPVSPKLLEDCIDVATQAPTGLNRESWRFVVVTEPSPKDALGALYRAAFDDLVAVRFAELSAAGHEVPTPGPAYRLLAERLQDFPALVLVCSEGRPHPEDAAQQVAFFGSVLPAAWSLMVALRARGLGATWTTLLAQRSAEVARVLEIPEDVTQTVLLPVGHTKDAVLRPAARRPAREVTYWNRWGDPR
jgi:nitroreductase